MVNFRDRWNTPKQAAAAADQPPLPIDQSQGRVTAGPSGLQPAAEGPSAARETSSASLLERFRAEQPALRRQRVFFLDPCLPCLCWSPQQKGQ